MNYCEFFSSPSQTLAQTTTLSFGMTKVINQTDALDYSGSSKYTGIWIPTSTHGSLDDHIMYDQRGSYLRYLSRQSTIIITLSETLFYINNEQQPIARTGEVIFLLFKLTFMPILTVLVKHQALLYVLRKQKPKEDKVVEDDIKL
jgi:hypothetical protein